jgi:predicted dehydrogenase
VSGRVGSVAVLGCGWAGTRHARAFRSVGARIAWAVDTLAERRGALAEETGAREAATIDPVLADEDVDAVLVCLPHNLHEAAAVRALGAHKHVLCEKPIAATLQAADRMIDAADRAGRLLMVAENVWFDPALLEIRELLAGGAIGPVSLVQIARDVWTTDADVVERPWFCSNEQAGGGIMMAGGVHDFEKARMLLGEIDRLAVLRAPQRLAEMEGDDTSAALVHFCSGAVGVLVESFAAKTPVTSSGAEEHRLRLDGLTGSICQESSGGVQLLSAPANRREASRTSIIEVGERDTFVSEAQHFLRCLESGEEPVTSGRSQRRPLELVLAAYRSMEQGGAWQSCPPPPGPS